MSVRSNGFAPTHLGEAPQRGLREVLGTGVNFSGAKKGPGQKRGLEKVSGIVLQVFAGRTGSLRRWVARNQSRRVVTRTTWSTAGTGGYGSLTTDGDYIRFEKVLIEALDRWPEMGLVSHCLMPNHRHLVVGPDISDILPRFVGWLTLPPTQRWHAHRKTTGGGGRTAVRCGWSR